MAGGRLTGDYLTGKLGRGHLVCYGALLAAAGLVSVLLFGNAGWALVGFACAGAGLATIIPNTFAAAGNIEGSAPGPSLAVVTTAGYVGFLAGPPLIGFVAQLSNIRAALWILVVLSGLSAFASTSMKRTSPPQLTRVTKMLGISLMVMSMSACRHPESAPVTLTFLDPEWAHDLTERNVLPDERLQEFTRQTGIRVKHLPAPEPALDQLGMARELLREGAAGPDVLDIDVVWPATLSQDLIDLKPYFAKELISVDPDVIASYTIKGKLVAVPFHADVGVLFYRRDLLQEYGYGTPPRTWDELEKMATRIQQGERTKGQRDFWGFVWPGAAGEGLTCNALEWQVGEGGGRIIEADNTISVNNPKAIRTWQRAAHWIGLISSPNVVSYEEWDAVNAFYLGKAAFFRGWARSYNMSVEAEANPAIRDTAKIGSRRIGITSVPAGNATQAATLGGFGLGVSRSAVHPAEALELVRFLLDREIQSEVVRSPSESLKRPELHDGHAILEAYRAHIRQRHPGSGVISRPSTVAGQRYEEVDHAYIRAVHSVLTGKTTAPDAAAGLEKELVRITGFKTKTAEHVGRPPVEAIHDRR